MRAILSGRTFGAIVMKGSICSISKNSAARAITLARLLKKNIAPSILNKYRIGDIRHCFGDVTKIADRLGGRSRRNFEEGMAELIEWVSSVQKPADRSEKSLAELAENRLVI
jgi:dTDP-L-rhamnose 4-epimerase